MVKEDRLFGLVMRERKGQCIALKGIVGEKVECRIYEDRPQVCRDCFQGSSVCVRARELQGLPEIGGSTSSPDP
jgi:Fe-S-cluster containining protein